MSKNGNTPLLDRLTNQLLIRQGSPYSYKDSNVLARKILIKRGHMNIDGTDTLKGISRGLMTSDDRAIDRSMKKSGGIRSDYTYDPIKNYAHKKKKY